MTELGPISELIPHAPPMVLIDEVHSFTDRSVICGVTIRPDSPFCRDGKVAAVVAIEYMAQATAALFGIWAKVRGGAIKGGLLLGSREVQLYVDEFVTGESLEIETRHVWGGESLANFECVVRRAGKRVAWATLNVLKVDVEGASP